MKKKFVLVMLIVLNVIFVYAFSLNFEKSRVLNGETKTKELAHMLGPEEPIIERLWYDNEVYKGVRGQEFDVIQRVRTVADEYEECDTLGVYVDGPFCFYYDGCINEKEEEVCSIYATENDPIYGEFYGEVWGEYMYITEDAPYGIFNIITRTGRLRVQVVENPEIEITKTSNVSKVKAGETIEYSIIIKNTGGYIMQDIELQESIASQVSVASTSLTYTKENGNLIFDIPEIAPEQSYTLKINVKVDSNASVGTISSNTSVSAQYATTKSTSHVLNIEAPSINVTNSSSASNVKPGDTFDYKINVKNNSSISTGSMTVKSVIDSNLEIVNANGATVSGNNLTWNISDLASNKENNYTIKVKVKSGVTNNTKISNKTTVSGTYISSKNVSSNVAVIIPEITVGMSSKENVKKQETFTYDITVKNTNSLVGSGAITVKSVIDSNLEIIDSDGATKSGNTLTWNINNLAANKENNYVVKVKVTDAATVGNKLKSTTSISGLNINESVSSEITVLDSKLSISLTSDKDNVVSGSTITYTLKVRNDNEVEVKNIIIEQKMDDNLIIESAKDGDINDNVITYQIISMPANSELTFTIKTKVKEDVNNNINDGSDENEDVIIKNETEVNEDGFIYTEDEDKEVVVNPSYNDPNVEVDNPQTGVNSVMLVIIIGIISIIILVIKIKKENNFYKI